MKARSHLISLFMTVLILLSLGLIMLFSASALAEKESGNIYYINRQLIFAAIGMISMLLAVTTIPQDREEDSMVDAHCQRGNSFNCADTGYLHSGKLFLEMDRDILFPVPAV